MNEKDPERDRQEKERESDQDDQDAQCTEINGRGEDLLLWTLTPKRVSLPVSFSK